VRGRIRIRSKAPLALAGLLAVPLYLAALLASSLRLDRPRIVGRHELPPSSGREALIWAAALIVPAILVAIGLAALPFRRAGLYVSALAGVAVCIALPSVSKTWIAGHIHRFPHGIDFIPDSSPSNLSNRGDWEHAAQDTIASIAHWTLAVAIGAIVVGVLLELRRRRGADAIAVGPPPAAITGEPEVSPVVEEAPPR
jgi:hypothetical protein